MGYGKKWRTDAGNVGFHPFARTSKIVVFELCRWMTSWLFARWWVDAGTLLDTLIKQLDQAILLLNADDTVVHDAQPPQSVTTSTAAVLKILTHAHGRWEKRVERMLTSCVSLWRWRILKASSLSCACVNNTMFHRLRRKWASALQEQSQSKSGFTKIQALKVFHKFRWVLQDWNVSLMFPL